MRLLDIARADVQDFADQLTADGLAAFTVQNILDPLRVIFRRAIRRDVGTVDRTGHLELRRPKGQGDRIATPAEAPALVEALPDFERALWATAFYTGMRRGELRGLRGSDVGLPARVIHVERGWDDEEGAGRQVRRRGARRADPRPARAGAGGAPYRAPAGG